VRSADGVTVTDSLGNSTIYDDVVFACHADQALRMLADPQPDEQAVLAAFTYQDNRAVLHTDTRFMPRRPQAWASWVYLSDEKNDSNPAVSLTYWMNNLQPLQTKTILLVTLNPGQEPNAPLVYNDHMFEHPVFDSQAIRAQAKIASIQGRDRYWFCGAYQRYGFHEDGLDSAVRMAALMGIKPPW
jgi:predicted NAD/FAD-binding protein